MSSRNLKEQLIQKLFRFAIAILDCLKIVPSFERSLEKILPRQCLVLGRGAELEVSRETPAVNQLPHPQPLWTNIATVGVSTTINGASQTVPLGRLIANTQVYILDNHLQPPDWGAW